jgi:uncharacterized protein YaaQ
MNKMIMAIVPYDRGERVLYELINAGYTATFAETQGGILRQSQLSLFIATDESQIEAVLRIIREISVPGATIVEDTVSEEKSLHGAGTIVFVWDLSKTEVY